MVIDGKYSGKVLFLGPLKDNLVVSELYVGVKMDESNDKFGTGIFNGKYYFEAPPGRGVFVRYDQVAKMKKFDPTIEGGPHKKVLKNQSSLAWLYGRSLDEEEARDYSAYNRAKSASPKPKIKHEPKLTLKEKRQKELYREWCSKYGNKAAQLMWNNLNKLAHDHREEEKRIIEEERLAELRRQQELLEQLKLEEEAALQNHENPKSPLEPAN